MVDIDTICLTPADTLRRAMIAINDATSGIALVVDEDRRLLFTVTDGDIRRAILKGLNPDLTLAEWARQIPETGNRQPTTAAVGATAAELVAVMRREKIFQIPRVDVDGRVVSLALLSDLLPDAAPSVQAVIMAGGEGTRLRPLTSQTPKPLLPVGGRPLMDHIVEQLRDAGILRVRIATHYKSDQFVEHFGNGTGFGVDIDYLSEEQPLGTAGALSLGGRWSSTLLVMNGDILTHLNHRSMVAYHREHDAAATMAVREYSVQVPYGVVDTDGAVVRALREKPLLRFFVNAGIYLLEPEVHEFLGANERLDMTDLVARLIAAGKHVVSFPIAEYWIDIGQHLDYAQAQQHVQEGWVGA